MMAIFTLSGEGPGEAYLEVRDSKMALMEKFYCMGVFFW
jgi:hypothetical protein